MCERVVSEVSKETSDFQICFRHLGNTKIEKTYLGKVPHGTCFSRVSMAQIRSSLGSLPMLEGRCRSARRCDTGLCGSRLLIDEFGASLVRPFLL